MEQAEVMVVLEKVIAYIHQHDRVDNAF